MDAGSDGGEPVLGVGENFQLGVDGRHQEFHVLVPADLKEPRDEAVIERVRRPERRIGAVTGGAELRLHIDCEHAQ